MQTEARGSPKALQVHLSKFEHQNSQDLGGGWWKGRPGLLDRPVGLPEKICSLGFLHPGCTDGTRAPSSRLTEELWAEVMPGVRYWVPEEKPIKGKWGDSKRDVEVSMLTSTRLVN